MMFCSFPRSEALCFIAYYSLSTIQPRLSFVQTVCEFLPSITQNVPPMICRRQLLVLSLYLDLLAFQAFQVFQSVCSSVLHHTISLRLPVLLNLFFYFFVNSGPKLRPVA
jgi:hypothetical protein